MAEEIKYRNLGAFSSAGGFNVANADPIDSRQLVADISHIFMDGNWAEVKPYPGLIVSAPSGEARIYVGREWSTANQHTDWQLEASWKKIGSGSVAVDTYSEAIAMATADTIGQVIYVKTKSTHNEAEYEAAPYIVIAAGSLQKLAASTAGGNIANDLAAVTTRVGTAEGEIDALQTAVGDANSGLVKGLADANTAIEGVAGRMDTAENEIDALQTAVGNTESGLVKDVADLQTLTGEHTETLSGYGERIGANETAVTELRNAVQGGVHFRGVHEKLPELSIDDESGAVTGSYTDAEGLEHSYTFNTGDVIIVAYFDEGDGDDPIKEPTKEYILAYNGEGYDTYEWIELGDVSVSDQKIADLEKDFDDHVKAMETAWSEHLAEADKKYATITNLQAAEKALEDHVAAMAPTIAAAADYAENKGNFALAANVVANDTFNQHVSDASDRMDGIDEAIRLVPVKSVTTGDVLKLSEAGALSVDMSGYVSTNGYIPYTQDEKTKLANIAAYAQVNVIEEVKVNGAALSVADKSVNIDLSAYAVADDFVAKTTTINGQTLAANITLDAADIATSKVIGDMTAGTTVESAIETLHAKIGSVSTVANNALTTVVGSNAIAVTNKNNVALVVKSGSALTVGTDGLDLVWTEL